MIIKAIKKIAPEDEITYDYGKNYFKAFIGEKGCRCDKCREKRRAPRKAKKKKN